MNRGSAKTVVGRARQVRRVGRVAPAGVAALALLLSGCAEYPRWFDPFSVNGRDGGGGVLNYPALMRIASAAQAGGDQAAAVGLFRRAAQMETAAAAPLVGAGN